MEATHAGETEGRENAFLPYPDVFMPPARPGRLAGLRLAVKDIFDVAGFPTGAGNPMVLAASGPKPATAPLVAGLLNEGALFSGKTFTDELAYSLTGSNIHFGMPVNPAHPDRIPGGSSSGSAVAVAADLADIGLGTDTSGSIRLPAACHDLIGWRPTHGLLPLEGCRPLALSFDTAGFLVRTFETLSSVMSACEIAASRLRSPVEILVPEDLVACCDPAIRVPFLRFIDGMRYPVSWIGTILDMDVPDRLALYNTILWREAWLANACLFHAAKASIDPAIRLRLERGRAIGESAFEEARIRRRALRDRFEERFAGNRIFLFPTLPCDPPARSASAPELDAFRQKAMGALCVAGLLGCPQLSFPAPRSSRAPLSLSLLGAPFQDRLLHEQAVRLADHPPAATKGGLPR